jgi:hypothetical protein
MVRTEPSARDYRSTVDRVAIARAERRRQVTEELESERDRAARLLEQRDGIILELDGSGVAEEVFAKMSPEDVELIRGALQGGPEALREGFDEEWLDFAGEDAADTELEEDVVDPEQWTIEQRQESEAEIVRLGEEIAASNRRQRPRGPWPSRHRVRAARSGESASVSRRASTRRPSAPM